MTTDLIARLEAAEGPSRELDAEIWWHVYDRHKPATTVKELELAKAHGAGAIYDARHKKVGGPSWRHCSVNSIRDYMTGVGFPTESLDAAVRLVPAGMEWNVSNHQEGRKAGAWGGWAGVYGAPMVGSECDTYAATPALAICIAALKAQAALQAKEEEIGG